MEVISFICITSNIIITKRNKIAIAPTYTIITIKGMKSTPSDINKLDVDKKTKTNQNTECMGLKDIIAITTENIIKKEKKLNN